MGCLCESSHFKDERHMRLVVCSNNVDSSCCSDKTSMLVMI